MFEDPSAEHLSPTFSPSQTASSVRFSPQLLPTNVLLIFPPRLSGAGASSTRRARACYTMRRNEIDVREVGAG